MTKQTIMKTKFSPSRVAMLLQRYFFENWSREFLFWGIIIFLFTALDHRIFVISVLFISGLISIIRLQKDQLNDSNGMHYLLLPASNSERITSMILLNTIYHFGMILLSYIIGNLLVVFLYHMIVKIQVPVNWDLFRTTTISMESGVKIVSVQNVFWKLFGFFALFQSAFMLGTLYFKKYAWIKTLLWALAIFFFLFLIQLILFKSVWDIKYLKNAVLPSILMLSDGKAPEFGNIIINYGSYLLLPFLWFASYYRLSEKQIG